MLSFFLISSMVLTVAPDRIARAFNRSRAIWAVALDTSKAFNRVWHAGLLHKLKSYGLSGQIFGLTRNCWNCWTSYKNGYAGLLVLHLQLLSNPWLIIEIVITLVDVHLNLLNWLHFFILEGGLLILIDCMIFLSPFLGVTRMSMLTFSFLVQLDSGSLCL